MFVLQMNVFNFHFNLGDVLSGSFIRGWSIQKLLFRQSSFFRFYSKYIDQGSFFHILSGNGTDMRAVLTWSLLQFQECGEV